MVEQVLTTQRDAVRLLLAENKHLVAALRDALVERHELIGTEITDILQAAQRAHETDPTRAPQVIDLRDPAAVSPAGTDEPDVG
jgi:hypothetical protein